jgi:hypothetical protein
MRQLKPTTAHRVGRRVAMMACVAVLGLGATACGASDSNNVTPGAPTGTTPAAPAATNPQSGGSGF